MKLTALYSAFATNPEVTADKRAAAIELQLARKLAYSLALPSTRVESPSQYYADTLESVVRTAVSKFNEDFPINAVRTAATVYAFWHTRYCLVHVPAVCSPELLSKLMAAGLTNTPEAQRDLAPCYLDAIVSSAQMDYDCECLINDFVAEVYSV